MSPFSIDHIVPRSLGGGSELDNLAYACFDCNSFKRSTVEIFDSESGHTVKLFNPRMDEWADHFRLSAEAELVIGITDVGRATVDKLRLNRPNLVNIRRLLRRANLDTTHE